MNQAPQVQLQVRRFGFNHAGGIALVCGNADFHGAERAEEASAQRMVVEWQRVRGRRTVTMTSLLCPTSPMPCLRTGIIGAAHHPTSISHLPQRRFGLGQPEGHLHGTVQRDGGGQRRTRLLGLACSGIQEAEATVAMGLERAHV